jgi:hypothetical protein
VKKTAALLLLSSVVTWSQSPPPSTSTNKPSAPPRAFVYKASASSAPAARLTGGSRGSGDELVRLDVLAPDQTGLTTQEQPKLYWYQSKASPRSLEVTLLEPNQVKPLLQIKAEHADKAGIQQVNLADHGVKLRVGVEYRWVVALISDRENRSTDLVASGFIKRVEPSPELKEKIAKAPPTELPAIYAEAGIWHDALSNVSKLVESKGDGDAWRVLRADMLRQVGLAKVADEEVLLAKK